MTEQAVHLRLDLELEPEADAAEVEDRALQLRDELLDLDVEDVQRPPGAPPPEGAKGVEVAMLGTLVVTASREVITAVVGAVANWLSRKGVRSVKLQLGDDAIELTDPSREDQRRLVEAFLTRHSTGGA